MKPRFIVFFLILALIAACTYGSNSDDTFDTEPPSIVARISPDPNAYGWHNTDVTVSFECTDADSGIDSCPADVTISTEGADHTIYGTATDKAGNSATIQVTVKIDKTAPNVELTAPADKADSCSYTLEGGASFTHYEPMRIQGTTLTNNLTTFSVPIIGTGSTLTLYLYANVDGDSETFAFQNIIVSDQSDLVAYDMSEEGSLNLISCTNPFNGAFASAEDGFQKYQRGVSPSIPSAVLDDSLSVSPTDALGIIKEGNTDVFFGVVDTVNPQNAGGLTNASWAFNIGGATGLVLSIDMGAMGDFESSDHFDWAYQIDGGPVMEAFTSAVDITEITGYPSPLEIKGTASDDLSGIAALYCNGSPLPPSGPTFACDVPMVNGDNRINVTATDLAGNASFSDMDVSFYEPELELAYADDFELIWSDYGSEGNFHASFYRPVIPPELSEFHALGHIGYQGLIEVPNGYMLVARELKPGVLASPLSFQLVWDSANLGSELPASFWKPIPPTGYHCLGLLVKTGIDYLVPPDSSEIMCVREDAVITNTLADLAVNKYSADLIWSTGGSPATVPFAVTQTIPKKDYVPATSPNDKTNENAIYVGSFTGSSYTDVFQDMDLAGWIDKRHVLQKNIDPDEIRSLLEAHAPFIYMHPEELFYPDDPAFILDAFPSGLCWGLLFDELDPSNHYFTNVGCAESTSASLMTDYQTYVENNALFKSQDTAPFFRYWIEIPDVWIPGDVSRAKAQVNILSVDAVFTDMQFWIFYPFNGPSRVEVCPVVFSWCEDHDLAENGRHYGDWEQLTLRFQNRNKELVAVYMSRHDKGQWFSRNFFNITLQLIDGHPIVFSGKYSHAFYPAVNDHYVYHISDKGIATVALWDETGYGVGFATNDSSSYEIINSQIEDFPITNPPWLAYEGVWGQYQYNKDVLLIPVIIPPSTLPLPFPYPYEELIKGPANLSLRYDFKYGNGNYWFWYPVID
jgi:hypothetical protein